MTKRTSARYTPDACAAPRREVFEEPGCAHLALGLGFGVAASAGVFAWWALGVGDAEIVPRASARYGGYVDVLARRTVRKRLCSIFAFDLTARNEVTTPVFFVRDARTFWFIFAQIKTLEYIYVAWRVYLLSGAGLANTN